MRKQNLNRKMGSSSRCPRKQRPPRYLLRCHRHCWRQRCRAQEASSILTTSTSAQRTRPPAGCMERKCSSVSSSSFSLLLPPILPPLPSPFPLPPPLPPSYLQPTLTRALCIARRHYTESDFREEEALQRRCKESRQHSFRQVSAARRSASAIKSGAREVESCSKLWEPDGEPDDSMRRPHVAVRGEAFDGDGEACGERRHHGRRGVLRTRDEEPIA